MTQERAGGYTVEVKKNDAVPAFSFQQMGGVRIDPGNKHHEVYTAGLTARQKTLLLCADPLVALMTTDLKKIFDNVSILSGYDGYTTAGRPTDFWLQKRQIGGTFAAGGVHQKVQAAGVFIQLDAIDVAQDEIAVARLSMFAHWYGDLAVEPIITLNNVSLAGVALPAFSSAYSLGPVFYNGAQIEGVQRIQYQSGLVYSSKRADGDPWSRKGSIIQQGQVAAVTLDGRLSAADSYFNDSGGTWDFYLWKLLPSGVRQDKSIAEHIKISAAAATYNIADVGYEGLSDVEYGYVIRPEGDPTVSTTSTIPV
jgi:hypothetical protein